MKDRRVIRFVIPLSLSLSLSLCIKVRWDCQKMHPERDMHTQKVVSDRLIE